MGQALVGIQYREHLDGGGAAIFAHASKLGLKGIVSKHREHAYRFRIEQSLALIKNPAVSGVLRFRDGEP